MKITQSLSSFTFLAWALIGPAAVWADPPTSPNPSPAPIDLSGYFDGYYGVNFNSPRVTQPTNTIAQSQNGATRNFDLYHNQFSLNMAELSVGKKGQQVAFRADFDFGEQTEVTHTNSPSVDDVSKNIGQAYVSYSPSAVPNLTVNFGKMYTHMGLETAKAKDDWNYSRSNLFAAGIPYWHLGLSATYGLVPGKVTTGLYIYNGWNMLNDHNSAKTLGLQLNWTPDDRWAVTYNLITGPEQDFDNADRKTVNELIVTRTLSPTVSLAADGIVGTTQNDSLPNGTRGNANWEAVTAAAKFALTPRYYFSPRLEYYWDQQGFTTTIAQDVADVTLTNSFNLSEGLEARLEGRFDHSSQRPFLGAHTFRSNQATIVLGVLYTL